MVQPHALVSPGDEQREDRVTDYGMNFSIPYFQELCEKNTGKYQQFAIKPQSRRSLKSFRGKPYFSPSLFDFFDFVVKFLLELRITEAHRLTLSPLCATIIL
jgi:hypothetical protein